LLATQAAGCAAFKAPGEGAITPGPALDGRVVAAMGEELAGAAMPVGSPGVMALDDCVRLALGANPTVRAARHNVESLRQRLPQVTALEDPIVSNTVYPIPDVAPQYSLMGYMPYSVLLAQQFPWFGTLGLRGAGAAHDVGVAVFELAAAELDVVEGVKTAYLDLQFAEKAGRLLGENRALAEDFLEAAEERYRNATATQVDVLRAEVAVADIDREIASVRSAEEEARAQLASLMHLPPEAWVGTTGEATPGAVPEQLDRLQRLAVAARPDLRGRLAAIARDKTAIDLARKRFYPDITAGISYAQMEERGAMVGRQADGMPNVGFFLGFNLPLNQGKRHAAVAEARERTAAETALYQAERDESNREVATLFHQAAARRRTLDLLREKSLPAARQIVELTGTDYRAGAEGVDLLSVLAASRDLLGIELQVAEAETELGKVLTSLERAVGGQWNESPVPGESAPLLAESLGADDTPPPPSPGPSPFPAGAAEPGATP
jgi:outer membrane protein TolC